MLTPTVIALIDELTDSGYHQAGCVAGIAIVVFAVLQTIVLYYFAVDDKKFYDIFPLFFNKVGSLVISFLTGYLLCSFVFFVICIMPLASESFMKKIIVEKVSAPTSVASVTKTCRFIGAISLHSQKDLITDIIDWLINPAENSTSEPELEISQ